MSAPLVSVIMPTYNRSAMLREAVASVTAQSCADWELIVVDDGSTDDTSAVLAECHDQRIRVVRTTHTGNPAAARNVGIAQARGEFVAFLDDDDWWRPLKLEIQLTLLKNSGCPWSYTGADYVGANGVLRGQTPPERVVSGRVLEPLLALDVAVAGTTVVVSRELFIEAGGFDESFPRAHDYALWFALADRADVIATAEPLTVVRDHAGRTHRFEVQPLYVRLLRQWQRRVQGSLRVACRRGIVKLRLGEAKRLFAAGRWPGAVSILGRSLVSSPAITLRALAHAARRRITASVSASRSRLDGRAGVMALVTPVLGVSVRIESGAEDVLTIAQASFGQWRGLGQWPELLEPRRVTVTIVADSDSGSTDAPAPPARVEYRAIDSRRLELSGPACAGWADRDEGEAHVSVAPQLLAAAEQFRYEVLEAAVLFLVTGPERFPVHASAVIKDGAVLLLAGPSGVGKSTLAWLAAQTGWQMFSDDIVYVQQNPRWRVWAGAGGRAWFARGAERFIPALAGASPALRTAGEPKFVLPRPLPMPPVSERAALCLLARGNAPAFKRVSPEAAMAELLRSPEPGFDVFPDAAAERVRPLAERAVRLTVGPNPGSALPVLEGIRASFFP